MTLTRRKGLRQRRSTNAPTKAQQAYHDAARELGCVICVFLQRTGRLSPTWGQCGATHLHHRNFNDWHGGKRIGQDAVVALGSWHHDGRLEIEWPPMGSADMTEVYGPSFKSADTFRKWTEEMLPQFSGRGTERWQAYQDELLAERGL